MAAVDKNRILIGLSESARTDFGRVAFEAQTFDQKVFSSIWELESQVTNGGFDAYFRHSDVNDIEFAPIALRRIGAHRCAEIVGRALGVIGPTRPTRDERAHALDELGQAAAATLDALDHEFFAYPDNLAELLFAFVHARPETFGPISK
jgi:hypothetical protein